VTDPSEWDERISFVLDAIYSAYTTGWESLNEVGSTRYALAGDAIALGRTLLQLMATEPEAHGLLSLMLHCEACRAAMMKLAYDLTSKQFGKVLAPTKVHSARVPSAFGLFYSKVSQLDKKLLLAPETALLIREQHAERAAFDYVTELKKDRRLVRTPLSAQFVLIQLLLVRSSRCETRRWRSHISFSCQRKVHAKKSSQHGNGIVAP
jgi:hypothetical protein